MGKAICKTDCFAHAFFHSIQYQIQEKCLTKTLLPLRQFAIVVIIAFIKIRGFGMASDVPKGGRCKRTGQARADRLRRGLERVKTILKVVDIVPKLYQNQYRRALIGEASLSLAIKTKCQECVGFEDVTNKVGNCSALRCPLWVYRPYQKKGINHEPSEE